ncbi:hypothetical protein EPA93_36215 [Ktedonosporobacter rubrisoli]|uniref:Phospholipid/glycerol acyltransferase domain-containing protein n=1 Tax=Ktedonosporobacter rubrisoli TaxID=2509675 RepID=A0A4P6JZ32_KTERU|nr:1-acyl-sn-glycerol-3-phosphate acyltransferase [Ktedonosporobacter rubrisoli]QBD81128.1 hypothetical protein EPA93_36215 [Ktedonosporobacter rubrisoli]
MPVYKHPLKLAMKSNPRSELLVQRNAAALYVAQVQNHTWEKAMKFVNIPFGCHLAALAFCLACLLLTVPYPELLNLYAGLTLPPVVGIILALLATSLVFLACTRFGSAAAFPRFMAHIIVRKTSHTFLRHTTMFTVEGLEWVPQSGPILIAARHFHHLYDGCALLSVIPRQLHILLALDWIKPPWQRALLERACALLDWPIILRTERLTAFTPSERHAYSSSDLLRYLRRAISASIRLLHRGEVLVIFPEAYPNIDPIFTPKQSENDFLPFRPGFKRLVDLAARHGSVPVAIIPTGLYYKRFKRWHVTLRFGQPLFRDDFENTNQLIAAVEERVQALSAPALLETEEEAQQQ